MNRKTFKKVQRQKDLRKFYNNKGECYVLARELRQKYPEMTQTQALISAHVMRGESILDVAKLKLEI